MKVATMPRVTGSPGPKQPGSIPVVMPWAAIHVTASA